MSKSSPQDVRDRPPADLSEALVTDAAVLSALLDDLRRARVAGDDALAARVRAATQRLVDDPDYAETVRRSVRTLMLASSSTHTLTESGLLADEGLVEGVLHRIGSRVAPAPPRANPLGAVLSDILVPADAELFTRLPIDDVAAWVRVLADEAGAMDQRAELSSALVILATRIAGHGLDPRLTERMPSLETWQSPFIALSRAVDRYAEAWVDGTADVARCDEVLDVIRRCRRQVAAFRSRKRSLGTTLHLSSSSLRMQQQLARLDRLVRCTRPMDGGGDVAVATVALEVLVAVARRTPVFGFVREKLDLISYLVIGHAAQKGEGYAADSRAELLKFLKKSAFGGVIVAFFGTLKPVLSQAGLPPVWQAALYGVNYAICFVLIYLLGATLATKQPSVTASRLAASLEEGPDHEDFARLVRSIWRSQYISFVGNIAGAAVVALLIANIVLAVSGDAVVSADTARYLAKSLDLTTSGTLFYAGVAGVMLSFAGLLSGFVDNLVVFHRLGDRVRAGTGLTRAVPRRWRARLADQVDKRLGVVTGNAVLGFLLGSAGTIGMMLGLPFDIRHIAFASAHGALALWHAPDLQTWGMAARLLMAVLAVGVVNFVVSFGLTLSVAVTARRVEGVQWRRQMGHLWRLLRDDPVAFFVPRPDEGAGADASDGSTGGA